MQRMPLFSSFDHLEGIRKRGQKSTDDQNLSYDDELQSDEKDRDLLLYIWVEKWKRKPAEIVLSHENSFLREV